MRRKTAAEKELIGTHRPDRDKKTPQFAPGALCPKFLSKTARAEWNRVAPMLEDTGLLQASDTMTLAAYCSNYASWREAMDTVKKQGMVIEVVSTTRTGRTVKPVRNPAVALMHAFEKAMLASAAKFGLDPHSRSRLDVIQDDDDDDPLLRFIAEGERMDNEYKDAADD
jgi:P27 family predicted phage terminase small subunit